MGRRAVFLDRDGTILNEKGYLRDPSRLRIYPTAVPGLKRLQRAGLALIIITNQSGVARGLFTIATLREIHRRLIKSLARRGIRVRAVYFCPHHPADGCECRKPRTKMLLEAARAHRVDLGRSFVVGDHAKDMAMAAKGGSTGVLVLTGWGRQAARRVSRKKFKITKNLDTASKWILSQLT